MADEELHEVFEHLSTIPCRRIKADGEEETDAEFRARLQGKEINMIDLEGVSLILLAPTGFYWTNQVGGTACGHPVAEGILIPVDVAPNYFKALDKTQIRDSYRMPYTASNVDAVLDVLALSDDLEPLPAHLVCNHPEMSEAWVPVMVTDHTLQEHLKPFRGDIGILTWQNSD